MQRQLILGYFDPIFVEVDEKDDIINMMGLPLKVKGKAVSESGEKRSSRNKKHRDDKNEERVVQNSMRRSRKYEKARKMRVEDEASGVSTSSALGGGHRTLVLRVSTLVSKEVGNLSTTIIAGVTIDNTKASEASHVSTDSQP